LKNFRKINVEAAGSYEDQERLPLDELYQHAVIGWMEVDPHFFKIVVERVEPSWFIDSKDVYTFKLYQAFYRRTKKSMPQPALDEKFSGDLLSCEEFKSLDLRVQGAIRSAILTGRVARGNTTKEKLTGELEGWLKSRLFQKLVHETTALYNKGKFEDCYSAVRNNLVSIEQATFGASAAESMDLGLAAAESEREHEGAISFGATIIDARLVENANGAGGLLPGDTTVLLAPVNVGKTTTMLTVAAHNVAMGKKVILTTHEGRALDIKLKFWCSLLRCRRKDLDEMWAKNVKVQGHDMAWWQDRVNACFTYVPLYGKNIEETIGIVRTLHDAEQSKPGAKGQGFHLWVDDYPGTITTQQAAQGKLSRRERDEVVYGQVVDLAGELKFHALCAIQSNREGARINKGTSKDHHNRLLTMEDVSESYGPMMRATNVISINRDPVAMQKGFVTFYVCKSRSSRTGIAVTCRSRYDLACTHANANAEVYNAEPWGPSGYAYEGTEAFSEKAEGFLAAHPNGEIPPSELMEKLSAGSKKGSDD
jgi:hypothetical protein